MASLSGTLTQSFVTERKHQHGTDRLSSSVIISDLSITIVHQYRTRVYVRNNISNNTTTHFNFIRLLCSIMRETIILHLFIASIEIKMVNKHISGKKRYSNAIQKVNGILHDNGSREVLVNAWNQYKNSVLDTNARNEYKQQALACKKLFRLERIAAAARQQIITNQSINNDVLLGSSTLLGNQSIALNVNSATNNSNNITPMNNRTATYS